MYVKPAPGRRVVDPVTHRPLGETAQLVERSGFWLRRLQDGDVTEVQPPAGQNAAPSAEEA